MSSVELNDENYSVFPGKLSTLDPCTDIFPLPPPAGRPSILRQSQAENLPHKVLPKAVKVCFQTPLRDPLTKRILTSPDPLSCPITTEDFSMESKDVPNDMPESAPIQSIGLLNFGNLDAVDPFISTLPKPTEPVLDETLPMDGSLTNMSTEMCFTESTVIDLKQGEVETQDEMPLYQLNSDHVPQEDEVLSSPLPPKGSYKLDLDSLDSINLFQSGGSQIQNSPVMCTKLQVMPLVQNGIGCSVSGELAPHSNGYNPPTPEGPVKLELNFEGLEVKHPKKLCQQHPRMASDQKAVPAQLSSPSQDPSIDIPIPKASYNFMLEDPNVNPFVSGNKMSNSPKCSPKSSFETAALLEIEEKAEVPQQEAVGNETEEKAEVPQQEAVGNETEEKAEVPQQEAVGNETEEKAEVPQQEAVGNETEEKAEVPQQEAVGNKLDVKEPVTGDMELATRMPSVQNEACEVPAAAQEAAFTSQKSLCEAGLCAPTSLTEAEEDFVPGATFTASGFAGQIDYLEQFGSSTFKESALRKQSLYLKFDPLLCESPRKAAVVPTTFSEVFLPPAFASRLEFKPMAVVEERQNGLLADLPLVSGVTRKLPQATGVLEEELALDSPVPPFPQPASPTEDTIVEVLMYSQKDMVAAVAKAFAQASVREDEWRGKYNELNLDYRELEEIFLEFEATFAQITAGMTKEKQELQNKLEKEQKEKEQMVLDLSAMERSFSDLFKRLEKHKEVIEGYKKNEETLKKCAQDYLSRVKKEEQRYQALKAHAEEKIKLANEEIAQLRTKHKSEVSAMQAQLCRERLKVQSLEKSLEQKEKETEVLTKLCDELIANVQKR